MDPRGLRIDGKEYPFPDMRRVTFGEAQDVAELTKRPFDEFDDLDDTTKVLGFVYIALRRADPATTIETVRDVVIMDVKTIKGGEESETEEDDAAVPPAMQEPSSVSDGSDESSDVEQVSESETILVSPGAPS